MNSSSGNYSSVNKSFLTCIITNILIAVLAFTYIVEQNKNNEIKMVKEKAIFAAKVVAQQSALGLVFEDSSIVHDALSLATLSDEFLFARVYNHDFNIFLGIDDKQVNSINNSKIKSLTEIEIDQKATQIIIYSPIVDDHGSKAGVLVLGFVLENTKFKFDFL